MFKSLTIVLLGLFLSSYSWFISKEASIIGDKSKSSWEATDLFGETSSINHKQDSHGGNLGVDLGINFPIGNFFSTISIGGSADNLSSVTFLPVKDDRGIEHPHSSILKSLYFLKISNRIGYLSTMGISTYLKASLLWTAFSHAYEGIEMFDVNLFGIETKYYKNYSYKKPGLGLGFGISYLVYENILGYLEYEAYFFNAFKRQVLLNAIMETHKMQIKPKYEKVILGIRYIL